MKESASRASATAIDLATLIHEREPELLRQAARDHRLTQDLALALLERRDLPHLALEDLSKNASVMKHRKVLNALVVHPRTPRHVSLPIVRRLYTFELMQIALLPATAADLKMFAEEQLINRLESISSGERLALAKRGSTRVAAALLTDPEPRVIHAALENPYLTEEWIVKAIMKDSAPPALIESVAHHRKWSLRLEIRIALLSNEHTPLARAVAFAEHMPTAILKDVLHRSRLPENVKNYLQHLLEDRKNAAAQQGH
jgi:hypothetical protein